MTLTPDEIASLVAALVSLLGVLALYFRMQINQAKNEADHQVTQAKVDDLSKPK